MKARKDVPPKSSTVSVFQREGYALSADTSETSKCLAVLSTSGTKKYESWTAGPPLCCRFSTFEVFS